MFDMFGAFLSRPSYDKKKDVTSRLEYNLLVSVIKFINLNRLLWAGHERNGLGRGVGGGKGRKNSIYHEYILVAHPTVSTSNMAHR